MKSIPSVRRHLLLTNDFTVATAALFLSLGTIGCIPVSTAIDAARLAATVAKHNNDSLGDGSPAADAPKPRIGSPGIIVFYPIATGGDATAADFAAGCGLFLSDAVAGEPEWGQTPLRYTVFSASLARKKSDERVLTPVTPEEATTVARVTGATHFATGEFKESGGQVTLSYTLYTVDPNTGKATPTGDAVHTTEASRDTLLTALPGVAKELSDRLRAATGKTAVTATDSSALLAGLSSETMANIGQAAVAEKTTEGQNQFLLNTGRTNPLTAQIAIATGAVAEDTSAPYVSLLIRSQPKNTQVLGDLGNKVPDALSQYAETVYDLSAKYPDSYAIAHTEMWVARAQKWTNAQTIPVAERAVRNAPANAESHGILASTLNRSADDMRQGRLARDMDTPMETTVDSLYKKWENQAIEGTRCDPLNAHAWLRVAEAATFAGDPSLATRAFDRAQGFIGTPAMNMGLYDLYSWGLEMFAPKWRGHSPRFAQVADAASKVDYDTPDQNLSMLSSLGDYGFSNQQRDMAQRLLDESAAIIQQDPTNIQAHYLHGMLMEQQGAARMAAPDFKANVEAYPTNASLYYQLGQHYGRIQQDALAEEAFRKADELRPNDPPTLISIAWELKNQRKLSEAETVLKQCLAISPNYDDVFPALAAVYRMQKRYTMAIPLYERSLKISPYHQESNVGLAICYDEIHRYADALDVAERYHQYAPADPGAQNVLQDVYIRLNRLKEAETLSRDSLKTYPNNPISWINLGEALARQGQVAEAHQDWNQALRFATNPEDAAEAQRLMKQFPLK